ncbi:MAG: PKD domain-containing protein, partial [Candidatus Kapabacteria bacterium]|nr:PKD domain-containing protein [Candidatus Kapabacteria bacterium]
MLNPLSNRGKTETYKRIFVLLSIVTLHVNFNLLFSQTETLGLYRGTRYNAVDIGQFKSIATDLNGNVYIAGEASGGIPTTTGTYQPSPNNTSSEDVYIIKFSPDLSTVLWATYFGGTGADYVNAMIVTPQGEVLIVGHSLSTNFPFSHTEDASLSNAASKYFCAKFSANGSQLMFCRLLSANHVASYFYPNSNCCGNYGRNGVALNSQGEIFVYTTTNAQVTTTSNAYQSTYAGNIDIFITKYNQSGDILYSSMLGGNGIDAAKGITCANGKVYLSGTTTSTNFPNATGKSVSGTDCFVLSWNDASTPTYNSAYMFGSSGADNCISIRYSPVTNSLITCGEAPNSDIPYTSQLLNGQASGGFIASINENLSGIQFITMLGTNVVPHSIALKNNGDIYSASNVRDFSTGIPLTNGTFQSNNQGGFSDNAITGISSSGNELKYGSYLGVNLHEGPPKMSLIEQSNCAFRIVVGQYSSSTIFPVTNNTFQQTPGTGAVVILAKNHLDTTKITATPTCGEYMFQGTSTGVTPCNAVNYFYNFGDGTAVVTGQQNVTHKYSKNGTFMVTYRVAYQGDTTYYEKTIVVQSQPTIKASPNVMYYCTKQNGIQLSASGGVRYEWSPGAVFSDSTKQNPIAKPTKNMWLYVRGYDANGCFATDSVQVYVTSVTAT